MSSEVANKMFDNGQFCVVVEDDRSCSMLLEHMLATFGAAVDLVTDDGEAAISFLENRRAAVVFLDLRMEKVSGVEVLRRLKQHDPGQKVIVTSGDVSNEIEVYLRSLGVEAILAKPYTFDELAETLNGLKLLQ